MFLCLALSFSLSNSCLTGTGGQRVRGSRKRRHDRDITIVEYLSRRTWRQRWRRRATRGEVIIFDDDSAWAKPIHQLALSARSESLASSSVFTSGPCRHEDDEAAERWTNSTGSEFWSATLLMYVITTRGPPLMRAAGAVDPTCVNAPKLVTHGAEKECSATTKSLCLYSSL